MDWMDELTGDVLQHTINKTGIGARAIEKIQSLCTQSEIMNTLVSIGLILTVGYIVFRILIRRKIIQPLLPERGSRWELATVGLSMLFSFGMLGIQVNVWNKIDKIRENPAFVTNNLSKIQGCECIHEDAFNYNSFLGAIGKSLESIDYPDSMMVELKPEYQKEFSVKKMSIILLLGIIGLSGCIIVSFYFLLHIPLLLLFIRHQRKQDALLLKENQ